MEYTPVDASGAPAPWSPASFVLPLRTVGQQLLSAFNTATVVEKEVRLTDLVLNGPEFDSRREAVMASETTMVRDTEAGLRYLVPDENGGERVVKEGFDTGKLFVLGGVFYDDSLDYPLPLAGVNYVDLDFRGHERQLNAFFGGVLGIVNYADPRFLGTKLDLGVDVFGLAIKTSDQLYRAEVEQSGEEVRELPATVSFNLGFPLGSFVKVSSDYRLEWHQYDRADATADDFVLPQDNLTQSLGAGVQFARSGYRLNLRGAWHRRSQWEFWGLPGNEEFDPSQKDYLTWEASVSKNWYFSSFRKLGLEINWADGQDLDRFSKYQFGFFGGNRVHGYQIGKVRAEEALAAHLTYGFEIGNLLRLDAVGDAAWATDKVSGLDRELLAGVGLQGIFMGPWETLISIDVGTPVAGPDDGVAVYLVFLKLFD
jgi:Omp85 superfamily domain